MHLISDLNKVMLLVWLDQTCFYLLVSPDQLLVYSLQISLNIQFIKYVIVWCFYPPKQTRCCLPTQSIDMGILSIVVILDVLKERKTNPVSCLLLSSKELEWALYSNSLITD